MHLKVGSVAVLLTTLSQIVFSQPGDSIIVQKGKEHAIRLYELATEGTHHLYNGTEYIAYESLDGEHPYFLSDEWSLGSLKYDGEWFHRVPLLYDIQKSKLIASYYYKGSKMELNSNLIDEFILSNRRFIHIKETTDSVTMRKGFYESIYSGKTQVLARRAKNFSQSIDGIEVSRQFQESNAYFILTNNRFKKVSGKFDILKALDIKKKEVQLFIRKNHLFKKNLEPSIIQTVGYFDSLIP